MPPFIVNSDDATAKEKAKWEQHHTQFTMGGLQPGNPYVYRPFPAMMFRARQIPPGFPGAGKDAVSIPEPGNFGFRDQNEWDRACQAARNFTTSCQRIVGDEREHDLARSEGWRDTPTEAQEHADALQKAISDAAAERNWQDRNMGERAKAESTK